MAVTRYTPHTFVAQPQKGSVYRRVAVGTSLANNQPLGATSLQQLNASLPFDNFNPSFQSPTLGEGVTLNGAYRLSFDTSDFFLDPRAGRLLLSIEAVYLYSLGAEVLTTAPFITQKVPPYSLDSLTKLRVEPQLHVLHSTNFLPVPQDFIDVTINGRVLRIFATLSVRV